MSTVPRLENPALEEPRGPPYLPPSSSPCQLTDIRNSKVKEGSYIWLLSDLILKCQYTSSFPWHLHIRVMSFAQYLFPKVDFVEKD